MTRETLFNYDFETDGVIPEYALTIHVRGIRNEYLIRIFTRALKEARKLQANKDGLTPDQFLAGVDNFDVPEKFFNSVKVAVRKVFRAAREKMEKKHTIAFLTWDVRKVFFYRNVQDSSEWILGVIYKGDYDE